MPRRIPASGKQRKAKLLKHRAIKRGDLPEEEQAFRAQKKKPSKAKHSHRTAGRLGGSGTTSKSDKVATARALQSAFLKPSRSFLDLSRLLSTTLTLPRPIPEDAIYPSKDVILDDYLDDLGCPKRPAWSFNSTKKEVEQNEERKFQEWLKGAQASVEKWRGVGLESTEERIVSGEIKSPSYFELNLQVWRQL